MHNKKYFLVVQTNLKRHVLFIRKVLKKGHKIKTTDRISGHKQAISEKQAAIYWPRVEMKEEMKVK